MRIWSLHPKYLDAKGLVALWREALLAQQVLAGRTRGYKNHPQLIRFKAVRTGALKCIGTYLSHVHAEAKRRGYSFDETKIKVKPPDSSKSRMSVTSGQVTYEFNHLKKKLRTRNPEGFAAIKKVTRIQVHPLFTKKPGTIESWEIRSRER